MTTRDFFCVLLEIVAALLVGVRALCSFLLKRMAGSAPNGEAILYLNVRVANREEAVKQQVGGMVAEGLANHPFTAGLAPALTKSWGGFLGNIAAMASTDEELTCGVGEALASSLASSNGDSAVARTETKVCLLQGQICVLRLRVSVSSDQVGSILSLAAGPKGGEWHRCILGTLYRLCPIFADFLDDATRTLVASQVARTFAQSTAGVASSLQRGLSGLRIHVTPHSSDREADALFEELQRQHQQPRAEAACVSGG